MPEVCGACTVELNREVETTTRRLLASLDDERRGRLADAYQGQSPDVLCAPCFNAAAGVINRVLADAPDNEKASA